MKVARRFRIFGVLGVLHAVGEPDPNGGFNSLCTMVWITPEDVHEGEPTCKHCLRILSKKAVKA